MVDIEVENGILLDRLRPLDIRDLRPLQGGASSLSYVGEASLDGRRGEVVVKVAPAGLPPVRNRDVLRQARVLRALDPTRVPVPAVVWEDPGDPPETPPLFVMAFVPGTSVEPLFDDDGDDPPAVMAERMHAAARVLGRLHALAPDDLGVGGEQIVTLGDEIDRWARLLRTVDQGLVTGWEHVAERLEEGQPPMAPAAIVHGDYRLGNLLAVGATVTAVIDWEIWSVSDPRVDLGWFLANADPDTYRRSTPYVGHLPGEADLLESYGAVVGGHVTEVEWFEALACFKAAATWSLIIKHGRKTEISDNVVDIVPRLLARATDGLG